MKNVVALPAAYVTAWAYVDNTKALLMTRAMAN